VSQNPVDLGCDAVGELTLCPSVDPPRQSLPWASSRCAARRIADCESLMNTTIFTPCICSVSLFSIATSGASPIPHSSASKTSIHLVPRMLWRDLHSFPCLHTTAAPTRPSSERYPSVHHIQTPALIFTSFSLGQRCAARLAAAVWSSMVVLTGVPSPGAGQFMPSVIRPCSCSFLTTLHIGAPEEGLLCSSFSLLLHAFSSLAANRCCLESKVTGAGVSPDSLCVSVLFAFQLCIRVIIESDLDSSVKRRSMKKEVQHNRFGITVIELPSSSPSPSPLPFPLPLSLAVFLSWSPSISSLPSS